ncbi:MAG: AAA family ATPase [Verrucomicrobia bacterium]|nr:AAA family ATPase [Verrucomicrobiota bacterium]
MSQVAVTLGLWESVNLEFAKIFPPDTYVTWFKDLKARCESDDSLILLAPNQFAAIWIEDNYLDLIRDKMNIMGGTPVEVTVEVAEPAETIVSSEMASPAQERVPTLDGVRMDTRGFELQNPDKNHLRKGCVLNPRNTFDNFIVGPSNQLAHAAATAVAAEPGRAYNPLFVYGDSGLGKTHLMQSVAHTILQQNPKAHVVYLSCEKFTNKFLQAIRDNKLDDFRRFYRKVDVLIIDDIQFLEGKERTQADFSTHLMNSLNRNANFAFPVTVPPAK